MADNDKDPFEGFVSQSFADGQPVKGKTSVPPVEDEGDDDAGSKLSADRGDEGGRSAPSKEDGGGGDRDADAPYDPYDLSEFSDPSDDEADSEDDDEREGAGDELDDEGDGEGVDDADHQDQRPSRKSARTRIKELTKARREAERQNAELMQRLARLEGRVEGGKGSEDVKAGEKKAGAGQQETTQQDDGVDLSDLTRPDPTDEKYKFGEVDSEYISDMVSYNVAVQMRKQEAAAEKKRQETAAAEKQTQVQKGWQELGQKGLELHDDFAEVVFEGAQNKTWALSETMAEMLPQSEVGARIAYHLARNPKESARVAGLSPTEQARYFGRIEAKFLAQQRATTGKDDSGETKRLKAPRKQPRGSGGRFTRTDASGNFADFEERVKEQQAAKKR